MLSDKRKLTELIALNRVRAALWTAQYAEFLRTLFTQGDWFVTLTFRDRHQDGYSESLAKAMASNRRRRRTFKPQRNGIVKCPPDPRLTTWEPDSRYRAEPGPPVRDAALREIEHWLIELGWEAAGRSRQEIFDILAANLEVRDRRALAKAICRRCLACELLKRPIAAHLYFEMRSVAIREIGWVIAEEFGRVGGRWHVHLIVRGVQQIRRKRWWKKAFVRFGRSRIEPIHGLAA